MLRMKKSLELHSNTKLEREWDEGYLELGKDPITRLTVVNCLKIIGSKPIPHKNAFLLRYRTLLLERQVNYVEDVAVTRDTENLGVSRKEFIQVISYIGQEI